MMEARPCRHHSPASPADSSVRLPSALVCVTIRSKLGWAVLSAWMLAWVMLPWSVVAQPVSDSASLWRHLLSDAAGLHLPTKFLERMPADFVRFEFDDLRTFAAEYHPQDHRMILDRSLSFNRASGTLRPFNRLTHKELQTLYHELFHAFIDYLNTTFPSPASRTGEAPTLIDFAREQQHCRYARVLITPIPQRKTQTEERFLSDEESWEALNETWAVFIGWAIWTQLELSHRSGTTPAALSENAQAWLERLSKADKEADLRGYYEPADPQDKAMAQKRFLAPAYRISSPELKFLLRDVLEVGPELIERSIRAVVGGARQTPAVACSSTEAL